MKTEKNLDALLDELAESEVVDMVHLHGFPTTSTKYKYSVTIKLSKEFTDNHSVKGKHKVEANSLEELYFEIIMAQKRTV